MGTLDVKTRFPSKSKSHDILISKIKKVYKKDTLNVSELSRLTDIGYTRLRRLLFDDAIWTVEEWFAVLVICDAMGALPQMHRSTVKRLSNYHVTKRYLKKTPKQVGPKPSKD